MRRTTPAMIHILNSCHLLQEFLDCQLNHRELIMLASRMALQPNMVNEFQRFSELHLQSQIASSIRARVTVGQFLHWVTPFYRGLFLEFCLQKIQQGAFKFDLYTLPNQVSAPAQNVEHKAPTVITKPPEESEPLTPESTTNEIENANADSEKEEVESGLKGAIPLGLFHGLNK